MLNSNQGCKLTIQQYIDFVKKMASGKTYTKKSLDR